MDRQLILDLPELEPMIEQSKIEENRALQRSRPLSEKIEESKRILRLAAQMSREYYGEPLIVNYSGGKDSDVMLHIAESCLSNDEYEVQNSHTSVDYPPTVKHIREVFKRLNDKGVKATVNYPKDDDGNHITMWNLILKKKMPPHRHLRYCCEVLKESSTPNRMCAIGVREDESKNRQNRDIFALETAKYKMNYYSFDHADEVHRESQEINDPNWDCNLIKGMKEHGNVLVNPIYYFTEKDIWDYVEQFKIPMNPIYKLGYKRAGCVGCPMSAYKQIMREFSDFPTYKQAYISAFDRMLEARKADGKDDVTGKEGWHRWETGEDVFNWWVREGKKNCKDQMTLFDEE